MMNSLDVLVATWCRVAWTLLLVFTAAVLVVAALRKPCRRAFGAERAFLLWLIPPVAMLASLLPHAATPASPLPPIIISIVTLHGATASGVATSGASDWRLWMAASWLIGALVASLLAVYAQFRYRMKLRGAMRYEAASRWPVLRIADPSAGPALVGSWRPCIVVPRDFDERYDDAERELILAHEIMHARRRDGCWCLAAQFVTAAFWFHPLAWWALSALRRDQELACDAGVLREHRGGRRSYANAMLKTQSAAFALPVGCAWSPRHPLTERIAMLKQAQPGRVRRASGAAFATIVIMFGAGGAYAATASSANVDHADRHTLKLELGVDGQTPRLHANICLEKGEHYSVTEAGIGKLPPWHGKFWVTAAPGGMLEVRTEMDGGPMEKPASPRLRTRPGQTATIEFGGERSGNPEVAPGGHIIKIDLMPSVGC
jgi:beta-lactamase regulating signal transducer with metallopeptidase domain